MKNILFLLLLLSIFLSYPSIAQQHNPEALQNWQNQKYAMFIHWGIYSVLGGVWQGKPVTTGYSEQIQAHAGIYSDTYAAVAQQFNPEKWNADSIVLLAKKAGMRSIVITSKHHDGFCLFHSAYTDFNVVDATPFHRDVIKELSEACQRHGLRFGLYFSLIDWHFPQAYPISSHNADFITPEHHDYNKKQVTELLTNYGPVSELWFDMGSLQPEQSRELRNLVHRLQPNCMVSGRLGNDMGDFCVMGDNDYPDYKIETPWQTPASIYNETWGYRSWQKHGPAAEKAREKLISLIKVVSRGGNYLLNIGPKGDGSVVPFESEVLLTIGKWLDKNGEAIYNTHPDPFPTPFTWGEVTAKPGKLYLHLLNLPVDNVITLPDLTGKVKKISALDDVGVKIKHQQNNNSLKISLPAGFQLNNLPRVLAITFTDDFSVAPATVIQPETGNSTIVLTADNALKHYSVSGVDYYGSYRSTVKESWFIQPRQSATYIPELIYSEEEKGREIDLLINDQPFTVKLENVESASLNNNVGTLTWGLVYLNGPIDSGIGGENENVHQIDLAKPWPNTDNKVWGKKSDWINAETHLLKAGMNTTWYALQEISSVEAQPVLVRIIRGDGVRVLLNGEELLVYNNPEKKEEMQDIVLLHLKKGTNQLLIKLYNRFEKHIPFALDHQIPQELYHKKLEAIKLQSGKNYPVSWQLHNSISPHRDLDLPNLTLKFIKQQ